VFFSDAITAKQALSWAVPDTAGNTLHLQWHMQTASTSIVLATRQQLSNPTPVAPESSSKSTESGAVWTCAYFNGELWVLSSKGTIGKFAAPSAISSILITQEDVSATGDSTVGMLIVSCAMGVFLQLALRLSKDSCVVQASYELNFRSIGHHISPTANQRSAVLFPSYDALVPFKPSPQAGDASQPQVYLACSDAFGVDLITQGTSIFAVSSILVDRDCAFIN
jgi:hypothetical protein